MKGKVLLLLTSIILSFPLAPSAGAPVHPGAGAPTPELAASGPEPTAAVEIDWLEPRGINIVDLVGLVPDTHLEGAILSYTPGYGIVTYRSGSRVGNTVTVETTVIPRYFETSTWSGSLFGCLGQPARVDQWGSVAPATTVRLYHEGRDVTSELNGYSYVPAGRHLPVRNPRESEQQNRYRYVHHGEGSPMPPSFTADGALSLPANMGCELIISHRNYQELTAVFTAEVEQAILVQVLGTQAFPFRSYIGVGYTGLLDKLMAQLRARYSDRHPRLTLDIPPHADYILVNTPTMGLDPYTRFPSNPLDNLQRPVGGTYRIEGAALSVDHVNTMGLPLYAHWKDQDVVQPTYEYLPHFGQPHRLTAPEYVVPTNVDYHPCMLSGTCPDWVLEGIWRAEMIATVVYLRVERIAGGMDQIPLKMVGPAWDASRAAGPAGPSPESEPPAHSPGSHGALAASDALPHRLYVPLIITHPASNVPSDVPGDRPYGWFTEDGRMLGFIPAQ